MTFRLFLPLFYVLMLSVSSHGKPSNTLAISDTSERSWFSQAASTAGDLTWNGTTGTASYFWKGVKTILTKPATSFVTLAAMMAASRGMTQVNAATPITYDAYGVPNFPENAPFAQKYCPGQYCPQTNGVYDPDVILKNGQTESPRLTTCTLHFRDIFQHPQICDKVCGEARESYHNQMSESIYKGLNACNVTGLELPPETLFPAFQAHIYCPGYECPASQSLDVDWLFQSIEASQLILNLPRACDHICGLAREHYSRDRIKYLKKQDRENGSKRPRSCIDLRGYV